MKRFSKIILSVSAASAIMAAMAVSASAEMTASYADGKVTLSDVTATGTSQTMLVLNAVDLTTIADTNIKQIDQKDDGTSFGEFTVGELADGTYEVRIGGDGTIQTATFTVGGAEVETKDIIIGDINLNGSIAANDVTFIKRGFARMASGTGNYGEVYAKADNTGNITIGDINLNGSIAANDVTFIKRGFARMASGTGNYGDTVTVVADKVVAE